MNVGSSAQYVVVNGNGQLGTAATTISSTDPGKLNAAVAGLEERNMKLEAAVIAQEAAIAAQQKRFVLQEQISAQQQEEIKSLTASLKEQASLLQKVNAQMELIRPAPQVASNNN